MASQFLHQRKVSCYEFCSCSAFSVISIQSYFEAAPVAPCKKQKYCAYFCTVLIRSKQLVYFALHYRALKEIRIHISPQSDRVDEYKITEILLRDNTILDK